MKAKAKATLFALNLIRYRSAFFILFLLGGMLLAADDTTSGKLTGFMNTIYCILHDLIPILAFTLFVLAGVAYGIGQFFGADTRAKAATWGMAALTGAIVMLVIYLIGPMIVKGLYSASVTEITCVP